MYKAAEFAITAIRYLFEGYCLCLLFREFTKPKIRQRTVHGFCLLYTSDSADDANWV